VNLPAPLPATGEVAPGVHVLDVNGFVVMAVEFRDFVLAVEAPAVHPGFESIPARPGSAQVTADALAAMAKVLPATPIRFLVVSHHHSDHLGGAGLFARAGATILTAPGHRGAVAKAASDRSARIETVSRQRTITDGERTVEILNTGDNPHSGENLVVWLPRERIVFQGDLFYYSAGQVFPPSGRDAMNRFFAGWLRERRIEPKAIYGVHSSGAAAPALLELALKPGGK
jgi:glyoxylase-like metal-dependent hydrolase (beta-lactamase superfamily II)